MLRYLSIIIFLSISFASDIVLTISDLDLTSNTIDIYMENNNVPVYGFQLQMIYDPGYYCEKGDIETQEQCEAAGFNWFYLNGLCGADDLSDVAFFGSSGGSAESSGFMVSTNSSGTILGFSLMGSSIPAGEGVLTTVEWNGFDLDLNGIPAVTAVNISGENGSPLTFEIMNPNPIWINPGCTDPYAINYNAEANFDNCTCGYPDQGDANWDGVLDILDLIIFVNIIISHPGDYTPYLDFNSDTALDVTDIVSLVNIILDI